MQVTLMGTVCDVVKTHYTCNGRVALQLLDAEDGWPYAMATVNFPDTVLGEGEVIVKDYSENQGMLVALVEAGIVEDTGCRAYSGHVSAPICRLLV